MRFCIGVFSFLTNLFMLTTYSSWGWLNINLTMPNNTVEHAYLQWIQSATPVANVDTDILDILPNVGANISTNKQIDKLFSTMIDNNYPHSYLLNHPVSRTLKGRNYALNLINSLTKQPDFSKLFN